MEEAKALLSGASESKKMPGELVCVDRGFSVQFGASQRGGVPRAMWITAGEDDCNSKMIDAFAGRTAEGISANSSADDVINAYGPSRELSHGNPDQRHLTYPNLGMSFRLNKGRIYEIKMLPALSPPVPMSSEGFVISPGEGCGPVKIGMKKDEVIKALGPVEDGDDEKTMMYKSLGLDISIKDGAVARIVGGKRGGTDWDSYFSRMFKGKSADGIGIGSVPQDVKRAWGKPDIEWTPDSPKGGSMMYKRGILLAFAEGRLVMVQIEAPKR
jgi:hypothetical protein